jgi:site-specific DNA recombinase
MTAPVRAAVYLRVSTGRQADNDLSIPDQSPPGEGLLHVAGLGDRRRLCRVGRIGHRRPAARVQRMIDAASAKPPAFDTIVVLRAASSRSSSGSSPTAGMPARRSPRPR